VCAELRDFYESDYSSHDERNQAWRALVAVANIAPILALIRQAGSWISI
jgi:hypothetical protein